MICLQLEGVLALSPGECQLNMGAPEPCQPQQLDAFILFDAVERRSSPSPPISCVSKCLKRVNKRNCGDRWGRPRAIVTDRLRSYRAAMNVIGNAAVQECGRWLNNRAENSHQPFRRREGAMVKFRDVKTLQKFAAAHASIHNHFNHDRHVNRRDVFKQNRSAALAEWRQLAA